MNDDPLNLDDLEFEQLIEQARALIPRYAPQWTDHNVHDPGMTLLDLLAFIVDQQIYQIGFVSDRHLSAFAALLGVRIKSAQAATGIVWANKQSGNSNYQHVVLSDADLQHGTAITTAQQPDLEFVLDADVHLSAAQPIPDQYAQLNYADDSINLTQYLTQPSTVYEIEPQVQNQSTIEFHFDEPLVRDGSYPVSLGIEIEAISSHKSDKNTPWGPLVVEYRTSDSPWQQVNIVEDRTHCLSQTGVVLIEIPAKAESVQSSLRLRLDVGYFPVPVRINRVEINALPIVQLGKKNQKLLGLSNGLPDQAFQLPMKGLIKPNAVVSGADKFAYEPVIQVASEGSFQNWQRSSDLSQNRPEEKVFQLDTRNQQILFGNGINGALPTPGTQIRHKTFFTTNGAEGNLTNGFVWELAGATTLGSQFGSNYAPLYGGEDAWDMDQLMAQARRRVRQRNVMLSNQDLLEQISNLSGFAVARADLVVGYDPTLPNLALQGTRTVVVTPWYQQGNNDTDQLDLQRYLQEIHTAIEANRVLGEKLYVISHQRVPIRIKATLLVEPDKDAEDLTSLIISRLDTRLALIQDPESKIKPWPLGRAVTQSEIKALLAQIPDVIAVPECEIALGSEPFAGNQIIELLRDEVAILSGVPKITIKTMRTH